MREGFADAAAEEALWLQLMRESAEHSPALADADLVAERAATHPDREDALLLAAQLVARPTGRWRDAAGRQHTRTLLEASASLPGAEPPAVQGLREALVDAGDVAAARI